MAERRFAEVRSRLGLLGRGGGMALPVAGLYTLILGWAAAMGSLVFIRAVTLRWQISDLLNSALQAAAMQVEPRALARGWVELDPLRAGGAFLASLTDADGWTVVTALPGTRGTVLRPSGDWAAGPVRVTGFRFYSGAGGADPDGEAITGPSVWAELSVPVRLELPGFGGLGTWWLRVSDLQRVYAGVV